MSFFFLSPESANSLKRFFNEEKLFSNCIIKLYLLSGEIIKIFNSDTTQALISQNGYFHKYNLATWLEQSPEGSLLCKRLIFQLGYCGN